MEKILYFDCSSGISGDMVVGAMLDLGADRGRLISALDSLKVDGYRLHFGRTKKCGIDAFDFDVELTGHGYNQDHGHGHGHVQRNITDIFEIIDRLEAGDQVKENARKIFTVVAEAEAAAHGVPVEQVHFHEVGAVDSIVDVVGAAVCLDDLNVDRVVVSPLAEGNGHVRCQHGLMPVPAPATANIAAAYGLTLRLTENQGEMVTPTGAAIAAALSRGSLPAQYSIKKIGIGAGTKDFESPNILRAMMVEADSGSDGGRMWVLETNLDDCTGEALGFTSGLLLEAGAADVWHTPVYMKKNRPGYMLSVLCGEQFIGVMERLILTHTTTIGIRRYQVERTVLERRIEQVETEFGAAEVKVCSHGEQRYYYPEYESIRSLCAKSGLSFPRACGIVTSLAREKFEGREKKWQEKRGNSPI